VLILKNLGIEGNIIVRVDDEVWVVFEDGTSRFLYISQDVYVGG
jgi:hypothetical protein